MMMVIHYQEMGAHLFAKLKLVGVAQEFLLYATVICGVGFVYPYVGSIQC